ncbi:MULTISPECIES: NAD(P)/FAD-dependent oxidoreductase [unclassified Sphingomonas]|uniref:NAD(P)/FAD-dependent oxidoreductase n=1 Tax=unclassified Sphingomonas TaxID=196159 RepID=UPI000701806C|nr:MULTISPECIES: FAD-binding oxidoreductase [unclassified Sphingomonas]KQS50689.1 FAD-dependent oxidoreductase [Sphingomonas sp. Leaf198]
MAPVYDIAIVGAGMAGASLAAALGPHARVLVLEAEDTPGYHATGRSAAFWSETYGGPDIQPLTTASGPFLEAGGHLAPLGSIHIGRAEDEAAIDAFLAEFAGSDVVLDRVDPSAFVPGLRADWTLGVQEASCAYIDVAALHAESIATARRAGVDFVSDAAFSGATRVGGVWTIDTKAGAFRARVIVDAAGAWADLVAVRAGVRPLGLQAYRRTMVQLRTDPGAPDGLPHIADITGRFYFKPEPGGRLWLSPHDETPTAPCDAAPEEIDIAIAVDRFERVVDWRVAAIERRWAGLRTFAPDRLPIYGFDPDTPAFFWCAGQGGFGIQTAPAAALLAASLLLGTPPDPAVAAIDPVRYSPHRF